MTGPGPGDNPVLKVKFGSKLELALAPAMDLVGLLVHVRNHELVLTNPHTSRIRETRAL